MYTNFVTNKLKNFSDLFLDAKSVVVKSHSPRGLPLVQFQRLQLVVTLQFQQSD